jgi:branched-subunit amino acid ABC-type transport system permease component
MFVVLDHALTGLLSGAYYIMLALGLSLIFSLGGVVNLAHGAFYALGAYLAVELTSHLGFAGALIASPIAVAVIGMAIETSLLKRLYSEDPTLSLLARTRRSAFCSPSASRSPPSSRCVSSGAQPGCRLRSRRSCAASSWSATSSPPTTV